MIGLHGGRAERARAALIRGKTLSPSGVKVTQTSSQQLLRKTGGKNRSSFAPHGIRLSTDDTLLTDVKMADDIKTKLEHYRTAPFDARFPNQNQTKNCWANYLDYHRCQKSLTAKGVDITPCDWYKRVYKSLCPISWIQKWDDQREEGIFPGKI